MTSISDIVRQSGPYEGIIKQLIELESQPKYKLQTRQMDQQDRKTALGEVSSSISKFVSKLTELQNPANHSFDPLKAVSSDASVVEMNSATGINHPGSYDITVHRLASQDTALSSVMAADGYDLAAAGAGSMDITIGSTTQTISVATTKTDAGGNTVDRTNKEILQDYADQMNNLFPDAAQASVFQVDSSNVQFSAQSLQSGSANAIQTSNDTGVMSQILSGTTHLAATADLDASFTIDGVTFTRSSNTVDDAITGLSFTLLKDTGTKETMTVQRDLDGAKSNINSFIDSFNNLNKTIRGNTYINGETGARGKLQGMRTIRNLTLNLRQTGMLPMSGAATGELASLSEIGISFKNDGTMYIEDSNKLDQALTDRPDEVTKLFTDDTSAVTQMKNQAEAYTQSGGIISTLQDGIDQKIDFLKNRIKYENRHLQKYEEQQRARFAELERITTEGQAQYNRVMSFQSNLGMNSYY